MLPTDMKIAGPEEERAAVSLRQGDRISFGERIKGLRKQRKWTLVETGQRSGLALSTISKAERGIISLTYDNILKLAFAFDLGMSELLSEEAGNDVSQVVTVERKGQAQ